MSREVKDEEPLSFLVEQTKPFRKLLEEESEDHKELPVDIAWLSGRLAKAPDKMGDQVQGLSGLNLPVFKTRLKDSCCELPARAAWRVYYAVSTKTQKVYLLFLHHKKEIENPSKAFLQQKISKAFSDGV